jgi:type II secretory pathway component GspD/PulD (secretin)
LIERRPYRRSDALVLTAMLCLLGFLAAGFAQTGSLRSVPRRLKDYDLPGLSERVNLKSLDPWDVVQLIEFLAYRGGINNIVIGKGVSGLTTKLKFEDVTVGDALEVVLSVNRLAYEVRGGIITIMTDEEYQSIHGVSFYDSKQVRIVDLQYAEPGHVSSLLGSIKSSIGTIVSDPVTGTLILVDTPEKIREMEAVIERADTISRILPTVTKTFFLQYANVTDIEDDVRSLIPEPTGSVKVDERTKSLIVTALPHDMEKVEHLVTIFDRRTKQVFIESKIVQVTLNDRYEMGINWGHLFNGIDPRFSLKSEVRRSTLVPLGGGAGTLTYKTILGGGDLTAVLDALKTVGETRILSNPHVAALDGEEATIKVITEQPYVEAQLESGTTNVVGEDVKFIEVGVTLQVTPRISDDSMISMSIRPEVSSVIGTFDAFRKVPIVRRSYAETSVMIRDGETIIIAGMIENEKTETESRVPFLGRLPLLGLLFKSEEDVTSTREMIVFLMPRIVSGERPHLLSRDMKKTPKPFRGVRGDGDGFR